jgi:hypothetical protein
MTKQTFLQLIINVLVVYATVFATWLSLSAALRTPIVGEDAAFLQAVYAPLVTIMIIIIVYTISILDQSIRRPAVLAIATAVTQIIMLALWPEKIIAEEYVLGIHIASLLILFAGWTLGNKLYVRSKRH